jgi:predicted permease
MPDIRYALRTLKSQPLFTLVAVLTLTLGIGANTAIFSLVYHLLLRPLPFPDPDRLVFVWNQYGKGGGAPAHVSIPDYMDRRADAPAIEDATLFQPRQASLMSGEQPEQLTALAVTPSFFSTLRRGPLLGRAFTADDAKPDADRFVILTHGLWASNFASDPGVVGRKIRLNGEAYLITGVLAPDFELPWRNVSLLVPFSFRPGQLSDNQRGNEIALMIARLRPGASIPQLNAQMKIIVNRLIDRLPGRAAYMRSSGFTGIAVDMRDSLLGDVRTWLYLLQAGVVLVLLIACANVANLLLMRASGRHRELAIRLALGASRWRLTRQLLAEGAVLSGLGAAGGILAAAVGVRGLLALTADQFPGTTISVIQPAVLAFTLAVAILTAAVFGIAPALAASRGNSAMALKEDSARGTPSKRAGALRTTLVIAETALALVLLVAAGLLVKGFTRLLQVDPGFATDHVLTARVALPPARYSSGAPRQIFWTRLTEKARQIPGVSAVGLVSTVPFSGGLGGGTYRVAGRSLGPAEKPPHARIDLVGGDYFRTLGIPVIEGETFREGLDPQGPPVVIIDQSLARRQFPGESAIGKQLSDLGPRNFTILGVVRTVADADLAQPVPEDRIYLSLDQQPLTQMSLVVKTAQEPATIAPQVRAAVQSLDPEQAISEVRTMEQWVSRSLSGRRTPMTLLALFGIVALVLSAIGIYGVLAFSVAQRVRELGMRLALGANRAAILTLVLRQGMATVAVGVLLGLAGAFVATRYLQSMLYGVEAHDAGVFGAVAALLLLVAAAACYVPARRATQVDPVVVLPQM